MILDNQISVPFEGINFTAHPVAVHGEAAWVESAIRQNLVTGTAETKAAKAKQIYKLCVAALKEANIPFEVLPSKVKAEAPPAEPPAETGTGNGKPSKK